MSDPRYTAGITQGCALSRTPGAWPAEVPGLGPAVVDVFGICVVCVRRQRGPPGRARRLVGDVRRCGSVQAPRTGA